MDKSKISRKDKIKALEDKSELLYKRLEKCDLCPRNCKVNRLQGKTGYCKTGQESVVYTAFLHAGEEPAISGKCGSGTIFFSGCNLKCIYCQNYKFSHKLKGKVLKEEALARIMCNLQANGAHNINLVTPTHVLPQILKALLIAFGKGLDIPIVYNTSGYEKDEIINHLEKIVDIYLTDMKYITPLLAAKYSHTKDYPFFNKTAVSLMYRQKKNSVFDGDLLKQGLIIRHLVLPGFSEEAKTIISWIKENAPEALMSLMFQYQPYFKAKRYCDINRQVNISQFRLIEDFLQDSNIEGWVQELTPKEELAGVHFKQDGLVKFL